MTRRTEKPIVIAVVLGFLAASACDPERPPVGQHLSLKGHKGALCSHSSECASGVCAGLSTRRRYRWQSVRYRYGKCTDKDAPKGSFNASCSSDSSCQKQYYCHKKSGRCSSHVKCASFKKHLDACPFSVARDLWPRDYEKYRRRGKKVLTRVVNSAVAGWRTKKFCEIDKQKMSPAAVNLFAQALKQTKCGPFASTFGRAVRAWLKSR